MKLSKKYTTITPLSKAIAMIMLIALPFVGFYLGLKYQQDTKSLAKTSIENAKIYKNIPSSTKTSDTITISQDLNYMNQITHFTITMPKAGGDVTGTLSGVCNGNINGRYSGGEGGSVLGRAFGTCSIAFLSSDIDISYTGTMWPKAGKANIDWLSHSGVTGENSGSFTQNFVPQP
ncbi:MAG: hypothetical protein WCV81_02750 [Microgenomates group bacterium]|jgi:hypothetical protein